MWKNSGDIMLGGGHVSFNLQTLWPHVSVTESDSSISTSFTAPVQDVIVTTLITNQSCQIAVDGIVVVPTNTILSHLYVYTTAYFQPQTVFTTGKASLKVPAGATLSFDGCNTTTYYIEGYLVHP